MNRLKRKYEEEIVPTLMSEFGIENKMGVPKLVKVVINMGVGDASKDKELLDSAKKALAAITGQIPEVRTAKKSVASFGVRKGMPVGLRVTLRGERMYAFLDKLFSIVLPRLRDFRGVPESGFDRFGNYNLGFVEIDVFPEVNNVEFRQRGLGINIVTSTKEIARSKRLLELMGMPFEKK